VGRPVELEEEVAAAPLISTMRLVFEEAPSSGGDDVTSGDRAEVVAIVGV
jgi:hypothetical protein